MTERVGDWQLTASGREFWPLDPRPEEIDIGDIAHQLARICRWGGATKGHYSVAEHCVMLAQYFGEHDNFELARWALMHDAAEAYLGDIVRPLKPFFSDFRGYERRLEMMIWQKYGLQGDLPSPVRRADTAILGDERDQLFGEDSAHSHRKRDGETGLSLRLPQWTADVATQQFLLYFHLLFPEAW